MNIAFTALTLISLIILTVTSPSTAFPTMIEGVRNAILLILKLTAIYSVWLSILKMMQASGLDQKLSKGLKPLIRHLFKGENDEAYKYISINLASNMLGMGGAATPAGIKAMTAMYRQDGKATDNMILLLIINATSIQLIPAAIIALRATAGSENAASIFAPTLISTFCSTFIGVVLCKLFSNHENTKHPKNTCNTHQKKQTFMPNFSKIKCASKLVFCKTRSLGIINNCLKAEKHNKKLLKNKIISIKTKDGKCVTRTK